MLELNKLYNMDCMDGMKQFPDKYFELAVVDPPYGINASKMTMGSGKHLFKQGKEWDANIPDAAYFSELFRVSQNQIIWGGTTSQSFYRRRNIGLYGTNRIRTYPSQRGNWLGYTMANC